MPRVRDSTVVVGVLVAAACVIQLIVMGRPVSPLIVGLVASYAIWVGRQHWRNTRGVVRASIAAILVQSAHLAEEYRTGFYAAFPPVFGADPWSPQTFLAFNLVWLAIFILGAIGVALGQRPAFLVALFLAIGGGIGNGLGHLALAVQRGGYFPGAYTAVLALVAGTVLLGTLLQPRNDAGTTP